MEDDFFILSWESDFLPYLVEFRASSMLRYSELRELSVLGLVTFNSY